MMDRKQLLLLVLAGISSAAAIQALPGYKTQFEVVKAGAGDGR